jgi:hypothetical protein
MNKTLSLMSVALLSVSSVAFAQSPQTPPCGPRDAILAELSKNFEEVPAGRGVAADGSVLELLLSPSGTWTVLISSRDGKTCFATAGEAWRAVPTGKEAFLETPQLPEPRQLSQAWR